MKSSIAKLTNSPAKQKNVLSGMGDGTNVYDDRNKGRFTKSDSLDIYKKQTELNVLADKINKHVRDHSVATEATSNTGKKPDRQRSYPSGSHDQRALEYRKMKQEHADLKYKYFKEYHDKELKRNAAGHAENPFMLEQGSPEFFESDSDVVAGNQEPWGANKYDPILPQMAYVNMDSKGNIYNENSRPRPKQEKIKVMTSKNVDFMPVNQREFTPKKALPMELATDSDYFTVTSKYHHSGNKYILKDSAGREVDRVTKEEYQEKYGDFLQRGTKKYGKENLQRRLYIKK